MRDVLSTNTAVVAGVWTTGEVGEVAVDEEETGKIFCMEARDRREGFEFVVVVVGCCCGGVVVIIGGGALLLLYFLASLLNLCSCSSCFCCFACCCCVDLFLEN